MKLSSLEYSQLCVNLDLLERNLSCSSYSSVLCKDSSYTRLQYHHYQILHLTLPFPVDLSVLQYQLRCCFSFLGSGFYLMKMQSILLLHTGFFQLCLFFVRECFFSFLDTEFCLLRMHLLILILILSCHSLVFFVFVRECFFLFRLIESQLMKMYLLFFSDSVFTVPPSCLESLLSVSGGSELSCLTIKNLLISWLPGLLLFLFPNIIS